MPDDMGSMSMCPQKIKTYLVHKAHFIFELELAEYEDKLSYSTRHFPFGVEIG